MITPRRLTRYNQVMRRTTGTAAALVACLATVLAQPGPPPLGGRLAGAMLLGETPLTRADLPEDLPTADRLRLLGYIDRGPGRGLATQVAAAIEADGSETAARAVASALGGATGADEEAAQAEALLRDRAHAVAAPFLYAYLAARYRLQFEQAADDRPALERLAKKYRTMIERVRNSDDALFRLLADDLDNRPALSAGATRHPREYLPDT
jgi:hypothetical protein